MTIDDSDEDDDDANEVAAAAECAICILLSPFDLVHSVVSQN